MIATGPPAAVTVREELQCPSGQVRIYRGIGSGKAVAVLGEGVFCFLGIRTASDSRRCVCQDLCTELFHDLTVGLLGS